MKKGIVILLLLCLISTFAFAQAAKEEKEVADYAMILKNQNTDFWVKMGKGIQARAEEKGIKVDLYSAQTEDDLEGQLSILEFCISKGYKGIGIAPLSAVNMLSGVGKAYSKGITIVNIDEKFDEKQLANNKGAISAFVSTDNVAVGYKGGSYLVDKLPQGAKVLIIEGKSGNQSSEDRANGAHAALEKGKLNIVGSQAADWDRQVALDVANTYIQQNPDLKGIYCCNDGMALGVVQAVINADKIGEILVVGTDGDKEAVVSIENNQLSATVAQDPAQIGAIGLDLLIEAVKNGNSGSIGVFPDKTAVDSVLITKDNVGQFK